MSGPSPNSIGLIDSASASKITGWVSRKYARARFTVYVDGKPIVVAPRLFARPDLMKEGIDGVGFTILYYTFQSSFDLMVAVGDGPRSEQQRLHFASTDKPVGSVSDTSLDVAVLDPTDVASLVANLNADTIGFLDATKKFGKILAKHGAKFDVHFIDGSYGSVSTRYRIVNVADGLQEAGHKCLYSTLTEESLHDIINTKARIAVFFRAPLNDLFQWAINGLRERGVRIVFDVDDLVFDESIIHDVDGVRFLDHDTTDLYIEGVRLYRRFALSADLITVSTEYLAGYARKNLEREAVVVRNSIGKFYQKEFESREQTPVRAPDGQHVIGYYSGSKTHQADFKSVYPALVSFLEKRPDAIFRIVGMFDLDEFPRLAPFRDRIMTVPFMQYWEMIEDLSNCDVIIAPLTVGDPFCEAKSELKFFEAALRKRPCIVSSVDTFVKADDGFEVLKLAETEQQWFDAFEFFYNPANRADYAERANVYAMRKYSYKEAASDAERAYFGFAKRKKRRILVVKPPVSLAAAEKKSVGVIIPELFIGGGGHRKILRFCKDMADAGHQLTIYVDTARNPATVHQEIRKYFYNFEAEVKSFRIVNPAHDVVICTHWTTAYHIRNQRLHGRKLYFVQDFEPMFEPVNSQYVKALATYSMGLEVVCFGNWIANRIESEFRTLVKRIPFTLDHATYHAEERAKSVDVLLFARPSQPRRCFELAVEALRILHKKNQAIRIGLYGEESYGDLGFQYHNFGLIKNQDRLADIYRSARVGMCFSPTNPSLVGYEMIASGLPLVDIKVPGWEVNFGGDEIVYYSAPVPEEIADVLAEALNGGADYLERVRKGIEFSRKMPSDDIIGESMIKFITD